MHFSKIVVRVPGRVVSTAPVQLGSFKFSVFGIFFFAQLITGSQWQSQKLLISIPVLEIDPIQEVKKYISHLTDPLSVRKPYRVVSNILTHWPEVDCRPGLVIEFAPQSQWYQDLHKRPELVYVHQIGFIAIVELVWALTPVAGRGGVIVFSLF
jgi:hypothetical protein